MGRHEAPPKNESPEAEPGAADGHREPRGKHARDGEDAGGEE
ncbi:MULTISPECIES: hypothetical protein [unclassified Nonomuraea]